LTDFDDTEPDGPLTPEEQAQAHLLTAADLKRIDEFLLSNTSHQWRKVARVIGQTMLALSREFLDCTGLSEMLNGSGLNISPFIEAKELWQGRPATQFLRSFLAYFKGFLRVSVPLW